MQFVNLAPSPRCAPLVSAFFFFSQSQSPEIPPSRHRSLPNFVAPVMLAQSSPPRAEGVFSTSKSSIDNSCFPSSSPPMFRSPSTVHLSSPRFHIPQSIYSLRGVVCPWPPPFSPFPRPLILPASFLFPFCPNFSVFPQQRGDFSQDTYFSIPLFSPLSQPLFFSLDAVLALCQHSPSPGHTPIPQAESAFPYFFFFNVWTSECQTTTGLLSSRFTASAELPLFLFPETFILSVPLPPPP